MRPSDWQFGASIQREVLPRTSVEFGYHRRWFQNFLVTDNLALGPNDVDTYTITAPQHPDLPGGGGYPATYLDPRTLGGSQLRHLREGLRCTAAITGTAST